MNKYKDEIRLILSMSLDYIQDGSSLSIETYLKNIEVILSKIKGE